MNKIIFYISIIFSLISLSITAYWYKTKGELEPLAGIFAILSGLFAFIYSGNSITKNFAFNFGKGNKINQKIKSTNNSDTSNSAINLGNENIVDQSQNE